MIEALINRQRLCPPKSIFRMIGWTTLAALKWLDNTRVKKFRTHNRPSCIPTTNNCLCVHEYYKNREGSRPFPTGFIPPRKHGVFLPSSPEVRLQLTRVGILVSSVICADQNLEPKLPKALTNYRISTISFNNKICYIMCGRNLHYQNRLHPT